MNTYNFFILSSNKSRISELIQNVEYRNSFSPMKFKYFAVKLQIFRYKST